MMVPPHLCAGRTENHLTHLVWPRRVAIMAIQDQSSGNALLSNVLCSSNLFSEPVSIAPNRLRAARRA